MHGYIFSKKIRFAWLSLVILVLLSALPAQAATYANSATAFSWIDPSAHARVSWTSGASCSAGYAGAPIDDDITAQIPLGFTFNYGGVDYTQAQIMSNGRLQFNNGYCGYGTQTIGPPPTYPYPYPDANLPRTMRIYGVDLDATPTSATGICPVATCYVSYSTVGSAPNRQFVVTWINVPEWGRTARTGSFNLQVILYETSNEFVYQFGASSHPTGGSAQIGWELTTSDYLVWATTVVPTANTAVRFYIPSPVAEFRMDESAWSGAGSVINSITGGTNGSPVGATQAVPGGKLCRGGNIPANTSTGTIDAVDSGLDVDTQIGSSGTITFWYKSNVAWNGGGSLDSQLFDATTANNRWFYLVKQQGNGRLRFNLTDSANNNFEVQTGNNTVAANTWTHIAVTWNLTPVAANNRLRIYINGTLAQSTAIGTTNPLNSSIGTLYLGDNRSSFVTNPGTGNSANGVIDEARIYNYEATSAVILRDYSTIRSCPAMDHIRIEHNGTGLTCATSTLTIKACQDAASPCTPYTGGVSGTLTATGTPAVNWDGTTGGAAGAGFVIASGNSSVTKDMQVAAAGTVVFGTSGLAPGASSATSCNFGSPSCTFTASLAGFLFSNASTGDTCTIPAQTAGIAASVCNTTPQPATPAMYLRAVQASTTNPAVCTPAIVNQTIPVSMSYTCNDPATCQPGNLMTINSTAISSAGGGVSLSFDANGSAPISVRYDDVGQITLNASKTVTPFGGASAVTLNGSSNAFVVKPDHFVLSAIQQTAAPNTPNPGAASASDAKFVKAGESFSVTVTAVNANGVATRNYGKEAAPEGVKLTSSLAGGLGLTANPALNNATAFGAFSNGVASGTTFSWDEVGIIKLTPGVADGDYLGAGDTTGTTSGNVGRFYPDHFDTVVTQVAGVPMVCPTGTCPLLYNGFVYSGQPFSLTVTAKNGLSTPTTTVNYNATSGFSKATTLSAWDALGSTATQNPGSGNLTNNTIRAARFSAGTSPLTGTVGVTSGSATVTGTGTLFLTQLAVGDAINISGIDYIVSAIASNTSLTLTTSYAAATAAGIVADVKPTYTFAAVPTNPTNIYIRAVDTDGVTSLRGASSIEGGVQVANGRVMVPNTYGSELLKLPIGVTVQYWNGTHWVTSSTDITPLVSGNVTIANCKKNLGNPAPACKAAPTVEVASVALVNGVGSITLKAPGTGNNGSGDVTINAAGWPAWLPSTTGRASFGIYKNRFIYLREMY